MKDIFSINYLFERLKDYFFSNIISCLTFLGTIVGGILYLLYYIFQIGYIPRYDNSFAYMFGISFILGVIYIFVFTLFPAVIPYFKEKRFKSKKENFFINLIIPMIYSTTIFGIIICFEKFTVSEKYQVLVLLLVFLLPVLFVYIIYKLWLKIEIKIDDIIMYFYYCIIFAFSFGLMLAISIFYLNDNVVILFITILYFLVYVCYILSNEASFSYREYLLTALITTALMSSLFVSQVVSKTTKSGYYSLERLYLDKDSSKYLLDFIPKFKSISKDQIGIEILDDVVVVHNINVLSSGSAKQYLLELDENITFTIPSETVKSEYGFGVYKNR